MTAGTSSIVRRKKSSCGSDDRRASSASARRVGSRTRTKAAFVASRCGGVGHRGPDGDVEQPALEPRQPIPDLEDQRCALRGETSADRHRIAVVGCVPKALDHRQARSSGRCPTWVRRAPTRRARAIRGGTRSDRTRRRNRRPQVARNRSSSPSSPRRRAPSASGSRRPCGRAARAPARARRIPPCPSRR